MLRIKNLKFFAPTTILYAVLIFYLSITSSIGTIRHQVNIYLVHIMRDILITFNIPFILNFLVGSLKYAERQSIDIGHVGIYFVFGILLYFVFVSSKSPILEKYSAAIAICVGTAYGIFNESFQMFLPYRTASIGDALSNMLGLVLAQILLLTFIFVLVFLESNKKYINR